MIERFEVEDPGPLLAFLSSRLDGWRTKTLKDRLRRGSVRVNGETVTRQNHPLHAGDRVEVDRRSAADPVPTHSAFTTLHADADLIAIDKPSGLLSVSTDRQRQRTALALLRDSLSLPGRPARLWPVHRLDRETSGVLLFARNHEVLEQLQARWPDVEKTYLAIVDGHPDPREGTIDQPLREDRRLHVHVGRRPGAKDASTRYRTSRRGRQRTLLEVELVTGRRHQIRAHLAWLGHPVVGDRRYGAPGPRLGLHARRLSFVHPRREARLVIEAPVPGPFLALLD